MACRNAAAAAAGLPALAAASPWAKKAFAAGVPLLSPVASYVGSHHSHPATSTAANKAVRVRRISLLTL